jgi:hypothetical protein
MRALMLLLLVCCAAAVAKITLGTDSVLDMTDCPAPYTGTLRMVSSAASWRIDEACTKALNVLKGYAPAGHICGVRLLVYGDVCVAYGTQVS